MLISKQKCQNFSHFTTPFSNGQVLKCECWLQDTGPFHFWLDRSALWYDFPALRFDFRSHSMTPTVVFRSVCIIVCFKHRNTSNSWENYQTQTLGWEYFRETQLGKPSNTKEYLTTLGWDFSRLKTEIPLLVVYPNYVICEMGTLPKVRPSRKPPAAITALLRPCAKIFFHPSFWSFCSTLTGWFFFPRTLILLLVKVLFDFDNIL